jgi:hypothetical protein
MDQKGSPKKKNVLVPIVPSDRGGRRSGSRRLKTVFNKACELWMRVGSQVPSRIAVMIEVEGELEVFLSNYEGPEGDWPPTRSKVDVSFRRYLEMSSH